MSSRKLAFCLCPVVMILSTCVSIAAAQESTLLYTHYVSMQTGRGELVPDPFTAALFFRDDHQDPVAPLFEAFTPPAELPALVQETATYFNDPDFLDFATLLANNQLTFISSGPWSGQGVLWGADGSPEPDLRDYVLTRVDQIVYLDKDSPGMDLNGDGIWTDIFVDGRYEFYGYPIPEPTTGLLVVAGSYLLRQRRDGMA